MKWIALAAVAFAAAVPAQAQDPYPSKPVHIVVPFPSGGVADPLARMLAGRLSQKWGQPVIVNNRPGASGNIGMSDGALAKPDGYTLVLAATGNLTVNPHLFKLPFDIKHDLAPVTLVARSPNVLVIHPSVPPRTFEDFLDYARANPGKLNFSSPGEGTGTHLAGELLNIEAGLDTVHIPYNGVAPAVTDLLSGRVQFMFAGISSVLPYIKNGRLVAIAIASEERSPQLPTVPTIQESGLPGFAATSWFGLVTRAGTPTPVIRKIQADVTEALKSDATRALLEPLGMEPVGSTTAEFAEMIATESTKWKGLIRRAHVRPRQ
jgi:tripartite-type tricarboxylate transporter receptor subunit TctC